MLHNFRLLFTMLATSFLLIACYTEPNENASGQQNSVVQAERISPEENTGSETLGGKNITEESTPASATAEAGKTKEAEVAEETEPLQESEEAIEELIEEVPAVNTGETVDPITQQAIERIAEINGLDKESYTFIYNQTEDYIEVEVREKTDEGTAPMVGKYRYMFDSEEILYMDYLTGEYIPYEEAE